MKSKLEELFDDKQFALGALSHDHGMMINDFGDMVDYLILEFRDRCEVYLNLYDDDEPPYRNILVKGSSKTVEDAKLIATEKLNQEYEQRLH